MVPINQSSYVFFHRVEPPFQLEVMNAYCGVQNV